MRESDADGGCTKPERLLQLLTSPEIVVNSVLPVNDETLYVGWCYAKEAVVASSMMNVVIATFTTAQARLKLFEVLHVLSARCLYYITKLRIDSAIGRGGR